jgi:hypothetical protein
MYENYQALDNAFLGYFNKNFNFNKYQVRTAFNFNNVNQHYEFLDGFKQRTYFETIYTPKYPDASFVKLTLTNTYYKRVYPNGNFAIQYKLGLATNNNSPFSPFVLDGFLNLRGIGNRVDRGTGENILNFEYRQSIINKKHFTIQAVAFTDIGSLRPAGEKTDALFSKDQLNYFSGLGIRIHSKLFYKAIFRLDYAFNLKDVNHNGLSFGLGHFF